jgi:hypothetical protein
VREAPSAARIIGVFIAIRGKHFSTNRGNDLILWVNSAFKADHFQASGFK